MPFSSPYPPLEVPQTDLLSYLFGRGPVSDTPLWIDSERPGRSLSAAQALAWAARLGCGLARLGLAAGDVVLLCSPNHVLVPVAFLASAGGGFVFSGINPASTMRELAHQLANSTAKVILAHPSVLRLVLDAAAHVGLPKDRVFQFSDDEANPPRHGVDDWTAMAASPEQARAWQWPVLAPRDAVRTVAAVNYSSGTTGLPKGVCVSHANLIASLEQMMFALYARARPRPDERWLAFLPLYHAYGELFMILMAAKRGIPVYVMAEFRLDRFLAAVERHRITNLHLMPSVLVMLNKLPDLARSRLSSVSDVLCGSAPLSREHQAECQTKFGVRVKQGWGMTEATCACTMTPDGEHGVAGSVGTLLPNCEAKLIDDEGREVEAAGSRGELCVRGPNVTLGYWRNEQATRELVDDQGWLKSGDVATCDQHGVFCIVDRKKDFIKVDGLKVAPAALEAVLLENEHVADAVVVGITLDEIEYPRAYVVIRDASRATLTPRDIKAWTDARVSKHKRLEGGVVFVDEVPRLASGKVQRRAMRERAQRDAVALRADKGATAFKTAL